MKTTPLHENHEAGENPTTKQIDSYKKSLLEAIANLSGGFPIMYALGIIILPLSNGWIKEDPLVANIAITGLYAMANFIRSLFLRRMFAKYGSYDNLIRLGKKLVRKQI